MRFLHLFKFGLVEGLAMSPEVGDNREILAYFFVYVASPSPFNLWRCGRLICVRLLFAVANNCLCRISDFENKFSVVIRQTQQSMIATASLGLLKPAEVVSRSCCWKSFPLSVFRFPLVSLLPPLVEGWLGKFSAFCFLRHFLMAFNGIRTFSP